MCLKHNAPFKCKWVPKEVVIFYFNKYPATCKLLFWDHFKQWMRRTDFTAERITVHQNSAITRHYMNHPILKWFEEIVNNDLNFKDNTMAVNHIHYRFGRIYREYHGYEWHRDKETGNWKFYQNGVEI